jgi:CHAD domain-containing protein
MAHIASPELVIRQRLNALSRELSGARRGNVESVHQARVATRRLREALPFLRPSGGKARKLKRAARRLTRALGPVRELDVVLEMLGELNAARDVPPAAVALLRQLIAAERLALHAEAIRYIDDCDIARLRKRAVAAAQHGAKGGRTRSARDPTQIAAAWRRAGGRAERLRAAIESAAGIYLPDRLHQVRIAVKKLRYSLEIVQQFGGSRTARSGGGARATLRSVRGQIAALKRAQDLLGRMHDFEILIARTRGVQSAPSSANLRLLGDLDRLVRLLEIECRQLHGHYMASRSDLLDICARVTAGADRASDRVSAA